MYEKHSGTAKKLNAKSQYRHTKGISKSRLKRIAHFVASTAYTRTHLPSTLTLRQALTSATASLACACVTQRPTE